MSIPLIKLSRKSGESVVVPIAFHTAISLFCALFIFPESVHGQFRSRFSAVFVPLAKALRGQPSLLNTAPSSSDFNPDAYNKLVFAAESALGPLASTNRLMKKDISWGRFGADDFKFMHELASRMTVRRSSLCIHFFSLSQSIRCERTGWHSTSRLWIHQDTASLALRRLALH